MPANEQTPLLRSQSRANESGIHTHEQAHNAGESAIASAFADPNASAFAVPPPHEETVDEEQGETPPEGVMVTETPMRTDLFIVLVRHSFYAAMLIHSR